MHSNEAAGSLRWLITSAAIVALGTAARPVFAQSSCLPADSAARGDAIEGRQYHEEGVKAADVHDWGKALELFQKACGRIFEPRIYANLGQAALQLGRYPAAAEYFSLFLSNLPSDIEKDKVEQVRGMLGTAKAKVGTVTLRGAAADAEVFVDGVSVGRTRDPIFVKPGWREFVAESSAGGPAQAGQFIKAGSNVQVNLVPRRTASDAMTSAIEVAQAPPSGGAIPVGHGSSIINSTLPYKEERSWLSNPLTYLTAATVAAAGTSLGFGIACLATNPGPDDEAANIEKTSHLNNATWFGLAAIGLGAGTGIYYWIDRSSRSNQAQPSIVVGTSGTGITIAGRF